MILSLIIFTNYVMIKQVTLASLGLECTARLQVYIDDAIDYICTGEWCLKVHVAF